MFMNSPSVVSSAPTKKIVLDLRENAYGSRTEFRTALEDEMVRCGLGFIVKPYVSGSYSEYGVWLQFS